MRTIAPILAIMFVTVSAAIGAAGGEGFLQGKGPAVTMPRSILWAWERPEDLRFLDPGRTGVAFLAKTVTVRKGRLTVRPRLQPLLLKPGTPLIAVVRIERDHSLSVSELARREREIVDEIVQEAEAKGVIGVQIDFDARKSERETYRLILKETRRLLPRRTGLTMTALASWCMGDNWMEGLPVDEAIPMLFRMGPEKNYVISRIGRTADFPVGICRHGIGVSLDEPIALKLPADRRLYIFSPQAWTREMLDAHDRKE
jgi:hypothetical protein